MVKSQGFSSSLVDRVAIVTGGANGIGRATAIALARFGADVAVCDRDEANLAETVEEITSCGRRAYSQILDVRDPDAVGAFFAEIKERFGRADVLVNNAGGSFRSLFLDTNAKGQTAVVNENFTSVTDFIREFMTLVTPDGGSIVNITSIEAFRAAPGFAIYSAMKAAVENLKKTLALEFSDRNVRVNTIAPDAIPTDGEATLSAAVHTEELRDYGWKIPLGMGHVDDVAAVVVFLASEMSQFVTGSTIHVDGGSLAASGWRRGPTGVFEP
jgi:3-oxoacyl-[acyl-carrier protein] reductase